MKKFDKVIKLLEQEKFRIIGKLACDYAERGFLVHMAAKSNATKEIDDAIDILIKSRDSRNIS